MTTYEYGTNDGRTITIEPNEDGSFTVTDNEGRSTTYGENVAENIYQDWDLHGVDISDSGAPPDPEPGDSGTVPGGEAEGPTDGDGEGEGGEGAVEGGGGDGGGGDGGGGGGE